MYLTFFTVSTILLLLYLFKTTIKPKNFPPGPVWYPIFGSSSILKRMQRKHGSQYKALLEIAKEYSTKVLGLKLGRELLVVVYGENNLRQTLTGKAFEGRPDTFFLKLRCFGKRIGITSADGPLWREQRQYTVKQLKNVGFGKTRMEKEIQVELKIIIDYIETHRHGAVNPNYIFSQAVLNILWNYVAGKRIDEKKLELLLDLFSKRSKAFNMAGGLLNQYPWCRYIIPERSGYNLILTLNKQLSDVIEARKIIYDLTQYMKKEKEEGVKDADKVYLRVANATGVSQRTVQRIATEGNISGLLSEAITAHKNNEVEGTDFIYSYMEEAKYNKDEFNEEQLKVICLDIIIAGSLTTGNALKFAIIRVLKEKKMQETIYEEIKKHIGDDTPSWSHNTKMVYTSAFLLETLRYYTIAPIAGPRRTLEDTVIDGYRIPKETTVLISIYDLHFDTELWDNPHEFKPERFIDENGALKNSDHLYPFGLGRRRCPGDSLARSFLFIIFVGILQKYRLHCTNGFPPSDEPIIGLITSPKSFSLEFAPRE